MPTDSAQAFRTFINQLASESLGRIFGSTDDAKIMTEFDRHLVELAAERDEALDHNDPGDAAAHAEQWADQYCQWLHDLCDAVLGNEAADTEVRYARAIEAVKALREQVERLGDGVRALTAENTALRSALDSALFRLGHVEEVERGRMVAAARAACVCRICGKPASQPFTLDFGREYAHTECLAADAAGDQLDSLMRSDVRTVSQPIPTARPAAFEVSDGEIGT